LDTDTKGKIKQELLMGLGSPHLKAGSVAAQVVAAVAAVELPVNHWPELIELLLGFVNNQDNTNLKIATLQAIGFICETIVRILPLFLAQWSVECLT
jgi:importin subunit beta-1